MSRQAINNALLHIGETLVDVARIAVPHGASRAYIQIVVAGQALDQFVLAVRYHGAGADRILADQTAEFGPAAEEWTVLIEASGDLTAAGIGTHFLRLRNLWDVESILLRAASANPAGSDVTVTGSIG